MPSVAGKRSKVIQLTLVAGPGGNAPPFQRVANCPSAPNTLASKQRGVRPGASKPTRLRKL